MKTNRNSNSFDSLFGLDHTPSEEEIKFNLFIQSRRVGQFHQALKKIKNKSQNYQTSWVFNHPELLDEMLNDMLDDSLLMLDGLELDSETVDLSLQLVKNIRQSLDCVYQLLDEAPIDN